MKKIYLVRHCKAVGQAPEDSLTEQGQEDATRLVDFFMDKDIEIIISSPYIRTVETIKPFAKTFNKNILIDERLKERVLSTIDIEDWMIKLKVTFEDMEFKFEGGESSKEAMNRGIEVISELLKRPESNMIIVTHGALLSLMLRYYKEKFGYNEWRNLKNPDIYKLEVDSRGTRVEHFWR